ncbi:MAG: nucleoside hydrolase [Acidimicrobiia bacterium]
MVVFPRLHEDKRRRLLAEPGERVRVIIDTDAANEIDDQFALAWALLSPTQLSVEAVIAEPYSFAHLRPALVEAFRETADDVGEPAGGTTDDLRAWAGRLRRLNLSPEDIDFVGPAEGMERSFHEIERVFDSVGISPAGLAYRGSQSYMPGLANPIESEGARRLIEAALRSDDSPLYVLAIGCVTNLASALLIEPEIARRIVVVWTSGYPTWTQRSNATSLNLVQDQAASRLLFESGVPLVYLPGYHIGAQLRLSLPEMEAYVRGRGGIGDYLYHLYTHNPIHAQRGIRDYFGRSWVIWDMINVAWVLNPCWVPTELVPTPRLGEDLCWHQQTAPVPLMRQAHGVDRDGIFRDFFSKLQAQEEILAGLGKRAPHGAVSANSTEGNP